jgi:hypothetical protein
LADIDGFNERNPVAVYSITERADWTDEERGRMRGLKSAYLAKESGGKPAPLAVSERLSFWPSDQGCSLLFCS